MPFELSVSLLLILKSSAFLPEVLSFIRQLFLEEERPFYKNFQPSNVLVKMAGHGNEANPVIQAR